LDEVDATGRLDVDVSNEAVAINHFCGVVLLIAHDLVVDDATTSLNITQERLHERTELCPSESIVELEE
jgi:hypothetical protein